ncbi:MAG: alanyl-tRNA synthetase [Bradymonadia bacterium]|jgi:alanyl-tRNA synthetase
MSNETPIWNQRRIRRTFLDYFVKHATLPHREVATSPLIPRDDPTLLFTNAGMNQFKSLLLGEETRDYTRATSTQKCIRAGGKHNDLDAVGKDARHLTFFEMLGNWSFGDYYKRETIKMSWDLSTRVFGVDPDRIYVSVYRTDDESAAIWADEIGIDPTRIFRFGHVEEGDEENFWSMGPTGPCGPCTELFYDLGPGAGTGPEDYMGGEGDRYMEFWNNVLMESMRDEDGNTTPLPMQSVDTGMGLERMALILQNKLSVYETDLFQPIIQRAIKLTGADWNNAQQRIDLQVIADHLRSVTFTISEGGRFSNEGRGYVLRRILRRAVRHGRRLGFDGPFLGKIMPVMAEIFEGSHDLPAHILENTAQTVAEEEERFFRTIEGGMKRLHAVMALRSEDTDKTLSGEEAFKLYDTYGFPVDLTVIEAEESGFSVDQAGFKVALEEQRNRARAAQKFYDEGDWTVLVEGGGRGFADYGLSTLTTTVQRWQTTADKDGNALQVLVLDQTPLYAESGGEVADHGTVTGPGFTLQVTDVQKVNGIIHHYGVIEGSLDALTADIEVVVNVDTGRRAQKTIHHTATHLMQSALKTVLGAHVEQKGSVVEPDRLRFDFSHNTGMTDAQISAVEAWVNEHVRRNEPVVATEGVALDDAKAQGVVALFGEKYGEIVRTLRAGSDSFELCGGNHVERTGDIGQFRITSEGGLAAGVRRIEAVVGHAADALMAEERSLLRDAAGALKTEPSRLPERIGALQDEIKALKRDLKKARESGGAIDADALIADAVQIAGVTVVAAAVEVDARETLAALVDRIRDKLPGGVVILGAALDGKVALIAAKGPQLKADKRFHAGNIVRAVAELCDGRGGGRPDFAQAGGKDPSKLADAMAQAPALITAQVG